MNFLKKNAAVLIQLGWLTGLVLVSCTVAGYNTIKQVKAYHEIQRSVESVDSKIEALAEANNLRFIPKPTRQNREGSPK